jgi:hypothetical protein
MTSDTTPPALLPEDLLRAIELVKQSDSIELKLTLPASSYRLAAKNLAIDPLDAQIRQVFFFDTPDLALDRSGVVVRARRIQGRDSDSTVKLRPVIPSEVPERFRDSSKFVLEVDAMPGGYVCSATLKSRLGESDVKRCVRGKRATRKLFSKPQRAFYKEHAPDGLALDDLTLLGPIFVLKLNSRPPAFKRKLTTELWLYPDGSRILELSTKCSPHEMFQVAYEARAFLGGLGLDLTGRQQTKTKTALQQFARNLGTG